MRVAMMMMMMRTMMSMTKMMITMTDLAVLLFKLSQDSLLKTEYGLSPLHSCELPRQSSLRKTAPQLAVSYRSTTVMS